MSQNEFCNTELQLATALNIFWLEVVRPVILHESLGSDDRVVAEEFGGALLGMSSCHKVLSSMVSDQKIPFPRALREVLPSLRDSYMKYTRLFYPSLAFSGLISKYGKGAPITSDELSNVDTSPSSIAVMPMQVLPKYVLLLKDALREGDFDTETVHSATKGIESLCRDLDYFQKKVNNVERIDDLNACYGLAIGRETLLLEDAFFSDSLCEKSRTLRVLLFEDKLLILNFKDREGRRLKNSESFALKNVRSVRSNSLQECIDIELYEKSRQICLQLFSDDSLLLSQWTLALSLAIDRATTLACE